MARKYPLGIEFMRAQDHLLDPQDPLDLLNPQDPLLKPQDHLLDPQDPKRPLQELTGYQVEEYFNSLPNAAATAVDYVPHGQLPLASNPMQNSASGYIYTKYQFNLINRLLELAQGKITRYEIDRIFSYKKGVVGGEEIFDNQEILGNFFQTIGNHKYFEDCKNSFISIFHELMYKNISIAIRESFADFLLFLECYSVKKQQCPDYQCSIESSLDSVRSRCLECCYNIAVVRQNVFFESLNKFAAISSRPSQIEHFYPSDSDSRFVDAAASQALQVRTNRYNASEYTEQGSPTIAAIKDAGQGKISDGDIDIILSFDDALGLKGAHRSNFKIRLGTLLRNPSFLIGFKEILQNEHFLDCKNLFLLIFGRLINSHSSDKIGQALGNFSKLLNSYSEIKNMFPDFDIEIGISDINLESSALDRCNSCLIKIKSLENELKINPSYQPLVGSGMSFRKERKLQRQDFSAQPTSDPAGASLGDFNFDVFDVTGQRGEERLS